MIPEVPELAEQFASGREVEHHRELVAAHLRWLLDDPRDAATTARSHRVFPIIHRVDPWSLSPLIGRFLSRRSAAPPGPPAGPAPGPFALADPGATRSLLEAAGWIDVDLRVDDLVVPVARDVVFDDGELEWRGVPEQVLAEARSAVTAELDRLAGPDGRLDAPLAVWTVTAGAG